MVAADIAYTGTTARMWSNCVRRYAQICSAASPSPPALCRNRSSFFSCTPWQASIKPAMSFDPTARARGGASGDSWKPE